MKLITVINAKDAIKALTEKHFTNFKVARRLVALRKAIDSEVEFYAEQEKKAVETYAEIGKDGNPVFLDGGRIKLRDAKAKVAFEEEIKKLLDTDVDDIEPVTLCEADFRSTDDLPSPGEMLALEAFILFED